MGRVVYIFILAAFIVAAGYDLLLPTNLKAAEPFERDVADILTGDGKRHRFRVEIVSTPQDRAQGLQVRKQLTPDAGMLFDYRVTRPIAMWMKNTLIPLDMLFIDRTGIVKNLKERARPHSLDPISAKGFVRGVLELPGGTVSRLGIKPGDRVLHPIFSTP